MTSRSLNSRQPANHSVHMSCRFEGDDKMSQKQPAAEPTFARETAREHSNMALTGRSECRIFRNATRIQESVTSVLERRALLWLAARMPCWVTSDQLNASRIRGHVSGRLLVTYWRAGTLSDCCWRLLCLALNWFGDSLDGTLARVRNRQRPRYGFYVDHMVDSFGALFLDERPRGFQLC